MDKQRSSRCLRLLEKTNHFRVELFQFCVLFVATAKAVIGHRARQKQQCSKLEGLFCFQTCDFAPDMELEYCSVVDAVVM